MSSTETDAIREEVRARYADAARSVDAGDTDACG
jgi:hypothetical protein